MNTAFIYSDRFADFSYGADHPMRPMRLGLTRELIEEKGLLDLPGAELVEARKATEEEVLLAHTPEYIAALKKADSGEVPPDGGRYGLGFGDNPSFPGVYEWSCYSAGASVQAAEFVAGGKVRTAFNIAGGLHHAMAERAAGFCYINDPVVAIKYLAGLGKRVAYVDIDAHHGDGAEAAFYDTDRVLTVSLHESGEFLFPGTGSSKDIGTGKGKGYSVNLPFPPGTGDDLFVRGFNAVVPSFMEAFAPDVLVTQLGVDTFASDPITHLQLTTNGFEEMVRGFRALGLPWVALGGGGYEMDNVKRAWTLAWAVMNHAEGMEGLASIRDKPAPDTSGEDDRKAVQTGIDYLLKEVLPLIGS
ncbi:MAG: acetoin utilization protein AcuC [Thermodesulfobacteriota bacterium]